MKISFKDYILINGVTCSVAQFAKDVNKTQDALRKNYAKNSRIIDAYIKEWRERK